MASSGFPMQARWTSDGHVVQRAIASPGEGLKLFWEVNSIAAAAPTMVEYADDSSGRALAIGAGRRQTVVTLQSSSDPPYFTSRATIPPPADEIWFLSAGENTPYPGSSAVPTAAGVIALECFLTCGGRSDAIEWERL